MCQIFLLAGIMIVGGIIGGLASFFSSEIPADEQSPLLKRIALGIAAALVVPLFLNMISSSILTDAGQTPMNYLIFGGFCIIAAFSSRAFLTTLSQKIVDKVEAVENKVEAVENKVESVEERQSDLESDVEPIISKETEPEPEEQARQFAVQVDRDETAVLKALANPKYTRRYLSGVASEAGMIDVKATYLLTTLKEKNLVQSKRGKRLDLYWITARGRDALKLSESEQGANPQAPTEP